MTRHHLLMAIMMQTTILRQIEKIRLYEKGYRAVHVINTGVRFGVLAVLAESREGFTVAALAVKLMLNETFVKIWCRTAYHFEILDCDASGRFTLQPFLEEVLGLDPLSLDCPGESSGFCEDAPCSAKDALWSDFVKSGKTVPVRKSWQASFATRRATKSIVEIFFTMIFPHSPNLKLELENGIRLLDVGCGSANLIFEFARIFKNSKFVGVDPDVYGIDHANEIARDAGLDDKIAVENMGGEEMTFQNEFDVVFMILTLHEMTPDVRLDVLTKIHQALKKGGKLIIVDYPYPERIEDFRNSRYEYGIMEQYFEAPNGVIHLCEKEQDDLLRKGGFMAIDRTPISDGGMLDLITASKNG